MERQEKSGKKALDDILKMSLKLSKQEETPLDATQIDPERREFLANALQRVLEDDDSKQMARYTKGICDYSVLQQDSLAEDQLNELYEICEGINFLLEGFDMNIVFNNCGGLDACLLLLEKGYSTVHWRVLDLIAHSVQNNEKCQNTILNKNGLQLLLTKLTSTEDDMVCIKSIYAISSLVGGNFAAENLFVSLNGVSTMLKFIKHSNVKVRIKAAFLLNKIMQTEASLKVDKSILIVPLIFNLRQERSDENACIAGLLVMLLQDSSCKSVFKQTSQGLKDTLIKRINELEMEDTEMFQDTIDSYTNLLEFI